MTEAQRIFDEAFAKPRDPRSPEYKLGCLNTLRARLEGVKTPCPYPIETCQADAYFSGCQEGLGLSRK